jgi:hypothetical protein
MTDPRKLAEDFTALGFEETAPVAYNLARELLEALDQRDELQRWGEQIHDALDGRPLPEYPDHAPARIVALKAERDRLAERVANFERYVEREIEPKLLARAEEAEAERDRLLAVAEAAKRIEWCWDGADDRCPACGRTETQGHDWSCDFGPALAALEEK